MGILSNRLLTSAFGRGTAPRMRVDPGSTGFFDGREFRFFWRFSVATLESAWIKAVLPIDCILKVEAVTVSDGTLQYNSWRSGTDVGPWSDPDNVSSAILPKNPWAGSGYTRQSTIQLGGNGAVTSPSQISGIADIKTAGATGQRTTAGGQASDERGVSAGTYFIQLYNPGGTTLNGNYFATIEERPAGT